MPKIEKTIFDLVRLFSKIFRRTWAIYYDFVFILLFLLLYPWFYFSLTNPEHWRKANRLRRFWARLLFLATGIRHRQVNESSLDKNSTYVFCPNHSSKLDIPSFALSFPGYYHFMGKEELRRIPLFGLFFRTMDISVDRESRKDSYRAFRHALKDLDEGTSLCIFPEGTTSDEAPGLLEFKNGPFRIAIEKQVPVVPVTLLDNWRLYLYDGSRLCTPGVSRTVIHRPIETKGMSEKDVEQLKQQVYSVIDTTLRKHYEGKRRIG